MSKKERNFINRLSPVVEVPQGDYIRDVFTPTICHSKREWVQEVREVRGPDVSVYMIFLRVDI